MKLINVWESPRCLNGNPRTWVTPSGLELLDSPEELRAYWTERYTTDEIWELASWLWPIDEQGEVAA